MHSITNAEFRDTGTSGRRVEAPLNGLGPNSQADAASIDPFAEEKMISLFNGEDPEFLKRYFGGQQNEPQRCEVSSRIGSFLLKLSQDNNFRKDLNLAVCNKSGSRDGLSETLAQKKVSEFMEMENRIQIAYRVHRERFPSAIWHCCTNLCFATIATDPLQYRILDEIILIHDYANSCHTEHEKLNSYVQRRRHGIGTSTVAFTATQREQRESLSGDTCGTERERALRDFAKFVMEVLPFLYGQADSPTGTPRPMMQLCTRSICCLLGVSRNFLYNRKSIPAPESATEEELTSLIDSAGVRLRQRRRNGDRTGYPSLQNMQNYDCGCYMPCSAGVPTWTLIKEYDTFIKFARELKPRHKENRFLLNRLYCPLSNSTTHVCNRALSALHTVSESLLADVRRVLDIVCNDPSLGDRPLLSDGSNRYNYAQNHPLNRYPNTIREKVEDQLNMVLRADPAGWNGASVCRVYSPEINTQEKLQKVLNTALKLSNVEDGGADLSARTIQRMIKEYLKRRNFNAISFTQSDHIACPNCKTLQYSVLQYHHEAVILTRELAELSQKPRPFSHADQERFDRLSDGVAAKNFQETECITELQVHNSRDARIRGMVKKLSDQFRMIENRYRAMHANGVHSHRISEHVSWNMFPNRGMMTHQDDMSKLDLPHFVESASSDITRWRFDVNAHFSSVHNDTVVLSHEQGTGPKNASSIVEEILTSHLLSSCGESIRVIVSDNASVGKNWITTVALPQYFVDQGLADIVLVVFLENNHGKWLADMLFGQFQSRRRRSVLLGIDEMLSSFENINRKSGKIEGFAVNPLSSIDFAKVLDSLGYQTKPASDFGFVKRNIHFAGACAAGAKNRLPGELRDLLECALPDDIGMVRLATVPPGRVSQSQLSFEDLYFDVPAARVTYAAVQENMNGGVREADEVWEIPLVVPLNLGYSPSGSGVVSTRTSQHVGFNGIEFRRLNACPELQDSSKPLIRQAWPRGLLEMRTKGAGSDEPVPTSESVKCAPLNWIVRRPVRHFCSTDLDWKARYPPRNLLNAKFRKGPREPDNWVPTATYSEPPFPIIDGTAACSAMRNLATEYQDIGQSLHFLHVLRAVYREMGDREGVSDRWLQRRATIPSTTALERYRNELKLYIEREKGHPKAAKTLRQVYKEDEKTLGEVPQTMGNHSLSRAAARQMTNQVLSRLFEEAEKTPGGLDRFYHLVEEDQKRYARELKEFKTKQAQFDKQHGLLPLQ